MAVAQRMTVAEYLEQVDDRRRTNLVDGEVVVTEALGLHQIVLRDLAFALELWVRAGAGRGETMLPIDIELDEHNYDVGATKARYEQYGLPELWLVDTAADVVLVFRRSTSQSPTFDESLELARGDTLTSPLLPGFALPLDQLFGPRADATG